MSRITSLIGLLLLFLSPGLFASDNVSITLQCNIAFSDFDNIPHSSKIETISLTGPKHKPGGMKLVTQTKDYEFWVMTHGVQTINNKTFINNFQVAIKHKNSQLFMHALSDTAHKPEDFPKQARVSLVTYHPNSSLEKGELLFECKQPAP